MTHEAEFREYVQAVHDRLEYGEERYRGRIMRIPTPLVLHEIEQEFLDIMGWGFEIWRRLQMFKKKLAELEEQ